MTIKSVKRDDGMALRGDAVWKDLQWVDQLLHQPVAFAEVSRRRYALWSDRQSAVAKHAAEKAHAQQTAALNLLSEGVAFGRYGAGIPLQDKLNILSGQLIAGGVAS
jgi:hypothetical protein